jgi:uncharacterized protein (DUF1800 family)
MSACLLSALALALPALPVQGSAGLEWTPQQVEHLFNRAGFGATREEIAAGLQVTPAAFVDRLLEDHRRWEPVEPTLIRWEDFDLDPRGVPVPPEQSKYKDVSRKEAAQIKSELARTDHRQFMEYVDRYFDSMISGEDALNDRMTLFWHGFFTTASPVVLRKFELIHQHQFLREHALGNFRDLLHGIVRDPGMLQYLDNNTNVRGHPNENLARELMELYSLGEGNYTELDVREAARALTGCHANPEGRYEFDPEHHDDGEKTVLGRTGKLGGAELVEILLAQDACPRWVSGRLIGYLEGAPPSEERLAKYAALLRESDYELRPLLRALFLDPDFYRPEILGARVQSPIDYLVGMCRKLELDPAAYVPFKMALELGEGLYQPPSVKGWEGGETWMTNALLMQRGNFAGILLGTLPEVTAEAGAEMALEDRARGALVGSLGELAKLSQWERKLDLHGRLASRGPLDDAELVRAALEDWLAIEPTEHVQQALLEHLRRERERLELGARPVLECDQAEAILRRMAHLVFSLPEAQLG